MSTHIKITADNLLNIRTKLDKLSADLSVEEQGLLSAVFQAAGCEIHGDVSGFGLSGGLGVGDVFGAVFGAGSGGVSVDANAAGVGVDASTGSGGTSGGISLPGLGGVTFQIGSSPSPRGRGMRHSI
jgi:hypothetical protein